MRTSAKVPRSFSSDKTPSRDRIYRGNNLLIAKSTDSQTLQKKIPCSRIPSVSPQKVITRLIFALRTLPRFLSRITKTYSTDAKLETRSEQQNFSIDNRHRFRSAIEIIYFLLKRIPCCSLEHALTNQLCARIDLRSIAMEIDGYCKVSSRLHLQSRRVSVPRSAAEQAGTLNYYKIRAVFRKRAHPSIDSVQTVAAVRDIEQPVQYFIGRKCRGVISVVNMYCAHVHNAVIRGAPQSRGPKGLIRAAEDKGTSPPWLLERSREHF